MPCRPKTLFVAALLPLAACTPPPNSSGYGGGDGGYGYGGYGSAPVAEQPYGYRQPSYGGGYGGTYGGGYGNPARGDVAYGRVIAADRVGGGRGNDLAGAAVGGVAGGLLGNQIGDGSGRDIATAVGAVGGALLGRQVAAQRAGDSSGIRWTIRLDDGRTVRIVQDAALGIGQRVAVSWRNGAPQIVG